MTQTTGTSSLDQYAPAPPGAATPLGGLSEAEAARRLAAGQGNVAPLKTSRSYGRIVRENVFNFINNVLFTLGALLIALGRYLDALISVGVIALNTIVSLVQEIRAKMLLDRIAILTRPKARVLRDGQEREIDPSQVVLGDVLVLHSGDQAVVDGVMRGEGHMEMDESLLTGESDLVQKQDGDEIFSGSFCVTGGGMFVAEKVGTETFVYKLTAGAQAFRRVLTPLQSKINIVIRSFLLTALTLEILLIIRSVINDVSFTQIVRDSVVIVALVPNGLVLAIALAYALGAVRMAGKGALVQQGNAVESISNVDVLCTDKTGTLTTNSIKLHDIHPYGVDTVSLQQLLGDFAASATEGNRTSDAVREAFGGRRRRAVDEVVFSSVRKWSALAIDEDGMRGTYVLGAPEMMLHALSDGTEIGEQLDQWTEQGLRVLLFAYYPAPVTLHPAGQAGDGAGPPALPGDLVPLGLVSLSDELRPEVENTLRSLEETGVALKIISGDNPQTVAALARQAGFSRAVAAVSGQELQDLDDMQLRQVAEEASIFGRVTPEQKERLVAALRANGHYVAMIGDGVNDVISLKRANVGIAMQGGSQAARGVADMILLKDSFGALPWAFREGQRIFNGMQDILRVFMVRILAKALLIVSVGFIGGFPFQPRQASLMSFFVAGIPAIALAAFAKPGKADRQRLMSSLMRFSMPAVLIMGLLGVGLFAGYILNSHASVADFTPGAIGVAVGKEFYLAQSVLMTFVIFCGLLLLPMVVPPVKFFAGGNPVRGSWIMTILAVLLAVGFMFAVTSKTGQIGFDVAPMRAVDFLIAAGGAIVWMFVTLLIWRHHLLDRFLGLDAADGELETVGPAGAPGAGGPEGPGRPPEDREAESSLPAGQIPDGRRRVRRYSAKR